MDVHGLRSAAGVVDALAAAAGHDVAPREPLHQSPAARRRCYITERAHEGLHVETCQACDLQPWYQSLLWTYLRLYRARQQLSEHQDMGRGNMLASPPMPLPLAAVITIAVKATPHPPCCLHELREPKRDGKTARNSKSLFGKMNVEGGI